MVVLVQGERLVIVNSVRLDTAGLAALDSLGKVTDVIRLAGFHGADDRFYKERYDASIWAMRGQIYIKGFDPAKSEEYFKPDGYLDADSELPVDGASLQMFDCDPPEGILRLEAEGGTLITGDSLQNWGKADEYFNWLAAIAMRFMGFIKPHKLGPGWLKQAKPDAQQVAGILDLEFDNVLPSHGAPMLGGAREAYRPAVEAYVAKRGSGK